MATTGRGPCQRRYVLNLEYCMRVRYVCTIKPVYVSICTHARTNTSTARGRTAVQSSHAFRHHKFAPPNTFQRMRRCAAPDEHAHAHTPQTKSGSHNFPTNMRHLRRTRQVCVQICTISRSWALGAHATGCNYVIRTCLGITYRHCID